METKLTSATKEVIIGDGRRTVLIGERINPTGKKKLSEALNAGNLDIVRKEALSQVEAGAEVIDVNVNTGSVDEVNLLPKAVQAVMEVVDVPLCFDSTNTQALEAALKLYKGKALINSVSGEEHSLLKVLPLVKEYGAAVIGLVLDNEGIPYQTERRVAIACKIMERAEAMSIPREDVIIDCLTFPIRSNTISGIATLQTIQQVKAELGVNLVLGASNSSFGMPDRGLINNTFVAITIAAGVNCLIVDTAKVFSSVLATDLLLGHDKYTRRYIEIYKKRQKT